MLTLPKRLRKQVPRSDVHVLVPTSTHRMDEVFGRGQEIRHASVREIDGVSLDEIRFWCFVNAVYQVPTLEMIYHLQKLIRGRKSIEICSGCGAVGRALDIPRTDSYVQERSEVRHYYEVIGHPIVKPPSDVEKLEAMDAVRKYDPEIVLGCFVTQKWRGGGRYGSIFGVDEEAILSHPSVKRYIVVGNESTHGVDQKRIRSFPHRQEKHDFLVSKCLDQSLNRIYVWDI